MKQKLTLSCALIHRPKVLFLVEPTTGVDPVSRKELWEMLKRLQRKGIILLISTAYMDEAGLCNRIAFIQDGTILKIERPHTIIDTFPTNIFNVKANATYKLLKDLKVYPNTHSVYRFGEYIHFTSRNGNLSRWLSSEWE